MRLRNCRRCRRSSGNQPGRGVPKLPQTRRVSRPIPPTAPGWKIARTGLGGVVAGGYWGVYPGLSVNLLWRIRQVDDDRCDQAGTDQEGQRPPIGGVREGEGNGHVSRGRLPLGGCSSADADGLVGRRVRGPREAASMMLPGDPSVYQVIGCPGCQQCYEYLHVSKSEALWNIRTSPRATYCKWK